MDVSGITYRFEVHLTATGIGAKNNKSYVAVTRDEKNFGKFFFFIGAGGGNRTPDLGIMRPSLCH
jgi:hypothetical protein